MLARSTVIPEPARTLILLAAAVFFSFRAAAQDTSLEQQYLTLLKERDKLSHDIRILEEEHRLSQEKSPYLVVDFRSSELTLKVHGLAVKRIFPVELRKLGRLDCTTGVTILERFEAARVPKMQASAAADTPKTVLVSDMPQAYRLGFRSGEFSTDLFIGPAPATAIFKAWFRVSDAFTSGGWFAAQALGFKRSSYRVLLLPEDAQALFWTLRRGSPAIFVCDR